LFRWHNLLQVQPEDNLYQLHISQNPQKIKEANSVKWICPYWKNDIANILDIFIFACQVK
jgi:hypothetical protein